MEKRLIPQGEQQLSRRAFSLMLKEERVKRPMNGTAYRIFKLAQWLMISPLSVEELNERFRQEPQIKKTVSTDSVWLYINTLKALGFKIKRPSAKNGFRYQMVGHPFGFALTDKQLDTLIQAKYFAQEYFNHAEMVLLDGVFKRLADLLGPSSTTGNASPAVDRLFSESRSRDLVPEQEKIHRLEMAIAQDQLVELTYKAPLKTPSAFKFLPEMVFYKQGVMYTRGERPDYEESSILRLDRIVSIQTAQDESCLSQLQARRQLKTEVVVRVFVDQPDAFRGFLLDSTQGVYEEALTWTPGEDPYYEVRLRVRDTFYLKQSLLALPMGFKVITPVDLKQSLWETLHAMRHRYLGTEALIGGCASHGG